MAPLWPKKFFFYIEKRLENLVGPLLCMSTIGQRKILPPFFEILNTPLTLPVLIITKKLALFSYSPCIEAMACFDPPLVLYELNFDLLRIFWVDYFIQIVNILQLWTSVNIWNTGLFFRISTRIFFKFCDYRLEFISACQLWFKYFVKLYQSISASETFWVIIRPSLGLSVEHFGLSSSFILKTSKWDILLVTLCITFRGLPLT